MRRIFFISGFGLGVVLVLFFLMCEDILMGETVRHVSPISLLQIKDSQKKTEEDIQEIYKLLTANNVTQGVILTYHGRLLHYVAGHQSFVKLCPECGLIEQLEIRQQEIYNQTTELSYFISENPNAASTTEKKKELEDLGKELDELTRRLFHTQQRSKEIGPLMKIQE